MACTFDELLEVGGAEGRDGDGVLRPERRLVVTVGALLQISQARGEHEGRSHLAADADERRGRGGFWLLVGKVERRGGCFEIESGRREIS